MTNGKKLIEIELATFGRVVREIKFQGNFLFFIFYFFDARKMEEHRASCIVLRLTFKIYIYI